MKINLDELALECFDRNNKEHIEFFKKMRDGLENRFSGVLPNLMKNNSSFFDRGYLISDNNKLIGYIDVSAYDYIEASIYLRASILSDARGKGYAKKILKEISDYIFKNYEEVLSIRLKIADDNIYSIKTALSCGYLNIPGTQMYVSFNPYVNTKDKIKF